MLDDYNLVNIVPAVITAVVALVTVWLSNRHNRLLAKDERNFRLKSELYMQAVEAFTAIKGSLVEISNLDTELQGIGEQAKVMSKLSAVASDKTVQALNELSTLVGKSYLELVAERHELVAIRNELTAKEEMHNDLLARYDQALARLEHAGTDSQLISQINATLDVLDAEQPTIIATIGELETELREKHKTLLSNSVDAVIGLTKTEVKALKSLREELKLPFDDEAYIAQVNRNNDELQRHYRKFLDGI